ncbi:hypothetical protein [Bordetella genomosp. 10]|uniref:hypothetical protein n=1 Tax=Bordetella genomosp. 10 TaxID=1416804 RepID=UPI001177D573|nr:hypothetical protein [Bordetella genomosp. 10]
MMDARKLLINLLYRATAQSSELPGWSHRETKKGPHAARLRRLLPPEGAFLPWERPGGKKWRALVESSGAKLD